ncbi:MAG: phosphatase PAP2 family protein [Gammaproteobacteria bacterium]
MKGRSGALLVTLALLFCGVAYLAARGDALVSVVDNAVFNALQTWRAPWADQAMVALTQLGSLYTIGALFAAVVGVLLWRRHWRAAWYWTAAHGFAVAAPLVLKQILRLPRPLDLYTGVLAYGFPSAHATMSMVSYGLLALLIAQDAGKAHRCAVYGAAGLIITLVVMSRLYLGAHWLSDALGGLTLGLFWVTLLTISYRRRACARLPARALGVAALLALLLSAIWYLTQRHAQEAQRYSLSEVYIVR